MRPTKQQSTSSTSAEAAETAASSASPTILSINQYHKANPIHPSFVQTYLPAVQYAPYCRIRRGTNSSLATTTATPKPARGPSTSTSTTPQQIPTTSSSTYQSRSHRRQAKHPFSTEQNKQTNKAITKPAAAATVNTVSNPVNHTEQQASGRRKQ